METREARKMATSNLDGLKMNLFTVVCLHTYAKIKISKVKLMIQA